MKIARIIIFLLLTILTGVYFGLGSFTQFVYFFVVILFGTVVSGIWLTYSTLDKVKNQYLVRLLGFSVGSLMLCVATYQVKNYINQKHAENLIACIDKYKLHHSNYPESLEQLATESEEDLPQYFYKLSCHNFDYVVSNHNYILAFNIDNATYKLYNSRSKVWFIQD
ncbi:hypothetical protein NBRC110019_15760 [Neptunitalea chrysea]|uniref:Uncharacterized protein n=1 Tax=Neptunitalea chrysea TaxID=1647581 RepID=A0A9W6EV61_9FLAO|nr:hypothetical protein [Neptunitalea chrysea]GLB52536.1 hypothetical protein NBRC110019_15760 [Neptunitalea chrysea]